MKKIKFGGLGLCFFVSMLMVGCSTPENGAVYKQWTSRMSELGIYPVFPPREDVQVGDIYLLPMHPHDTKLVQYAGGLGISGVHLASVDGMVTNVSKMLTAQYKRRPAWLPTEPNAAFFTNGLVLANLPRLSTNETRSIFEGDKPYRLRQVAFPEFSATVADQGAISAMVPVEAFLVSGGFDFSRADSVSFKVPLAESYGGEVGPIVEPFVKTNLISDNLGNFYLCADQVLSPATAKLARHMFNESIDLQIREKVKWWRHPIDRRKLKHHDTNALYLALITEVYYARAMDISVYSSRGFGAAGGATPVAGGASLGNANKMGKLSTGTVKGAAAATNVTQQASTNLDLAATAHGETSNLTDTATAMDLANQLRDLNSGQSTVGGSVQVVAASSHTVGLRRMFQYPVAVGVRGVLLKIESQPTSFTNNSGTLRGFKILN